ncbi:MarR family winged helix-turn-helix transcriptional regulator [Georgenia sp. H159]|uniref:MarR family winged helix-turn-helix transcriptional regulator n=1 Tax=Georgenia sp. H159 TaxID=3076115 RepID=UPI002D773301|nr:MarR family transcriptional regulator [Georgenia sp. H159]
MAITDESGRGEVIAAIEEHERALVRLYSRTRVSPLLETALTMQQLKALLHLSAEGPVVSHRLADSLGITPASVTGLVDRLVERGLVHRAEDPQDRRTRLVELTADGLTTVDRLLTAGAEHRRDLLSRLDIEALHAVATAFAALHRAAEQALSEDTAG